MQHGVPGRSRDDAAAWWRGGLVYQAYVRSFADSNGDGIGDLAGVTSRLDYLEWLGVEAVWLSPITPSPNEDWGYDVSDYCDVHPELGDLGDLDALVSEGHARGIEIVLDLVPNHTSDRHEWFLSSHSSRDSPHRDWYVWADPKPDGSPPNNWVSVFGGPAWTLDEATGQYYLHNFHPAQPDLNWWNDEVRDAFDRILRFWYDRGIAGFRIDVAHGIVKDRELRDNPPATESDSDDVRTHGQRSVYNMHRPEVHDLLRRWRALSESYEPARVLLGETWVTDLELWAAYYGSGDDELHMAFNFAFALAPLDAGEVRQIVGDTEAVLPPAAWPVWTLSNHDIGRFPTRACGGDERKVRCLLTALLTLRGTPVLYYGDELGMGDGSVRPEETRDRMGRDGARTPMQWSGDPNGGFTSADAAPWLPLAGPAERNVEGQRRDPDSLLHLTRDLVALRRDLRELRDGFYAALDAPPGVWAWRRGKRVVVAVNLSGASVSLPDVRGSIALATRRARNGESLAGGLQLDAWEAAVVISDVP